MKLPLAAFLCCCFAAGIGHAGEITFNFACDASAAVALDARTFVVADDENNVLRVYSLDKPGMPLAQFPMGRFLKTNVSKHPEADIEAATRVGDRIYWIGSHGRSKSGKWRRSRYLFFATRIVEKDGAYLLEPEGSPCRSLLTALLKVPDLGVAEAVGKVGKDASGDLAPKEEGLNIEGLCVSRDGSVLYLGLRNPRPGGKAALVPLLNAAAVIGEGAKPILGVPLLLDFGGRGIRSIEYSEAHGCYFVVAGSHANAAISALYSWNGSAEARPKLVREFEDFNAEAIAPVPGGGVLQLFSDDGNVRHPAHPKESSEPLKDGTCACKALIDPRQKAFRSLAIEPGK